MSDTRLYCPALAQGRFEVSTEEARHALASRRLRIGDPVILFDGAGHEASATITAAGRNDLAFSVGPVQDRPCDLPHRLTIAVAMPKAARQGLLIEKCTELGASAIRPIIARRSVVLFKGDPSAKWHRRAIEAAKQSKRAWVPEVARPRPFAEDIKDIAGFDLAMLAHPGGESILDRLSMLREGARLIAYIGPEGGWSDEERAIARECGATEVCLAPRVLRTETAAMAVCALVAAIGANRPHG